MSYNGEYEDTDDRFFNGLIKPIITQELHRRPEREAAIDADDVTNLIIAVNTAHSLEEFLEMV